MAAKHTDDRNLGIPASAKFVGIAAGYAATLGFVGFLLFFHLDNHPLWGDEGETAVLARNILRFGVPKTFDGTN